MRGPNRTYVEMMMDLSDRGKMHLPSRLYKDCEKACYVLYQKPELVEQVIQMRIKIYKEFNKYDGYHRLLDYQKFMIDYIIICKLLGKSCYVTMPYRAGKGIFYKILMNMWYGDMMMILTIPDSPKPFKPLRPINSATYSNKTNPIYIPKNVQHRKKGRR